MSSTGSYSSGGMPKNPTFSTLKISAGGTFDLYNTADKTTNYERLRADYSGNLARLWTGFAGTGAIRGLRIGIATAAGSSSLTRYFEFTNTGAFNLDATQSGSGATSVSIISGLTQTASTQTVFAVAPTFNQSGTAGYTVVDINPTETATGSGTKLLQRWAVGGSAKAQIDNSGSLSATNLTALNLLGLATALGTTGDVNLSRDAADTLALRRGPNAQTFRVYNTYTDASNYERGVAQWSASDFQIGTQAAGTGAGRNLTFIVNGTGAWRVSASGGHFLAVTDNTYDIGANGATRPRNIYVGGTIFAPFTRTLPVQTVASIGASNVGTRSFVTDSTVAAAGNFGAIVVGGGANAVPVFHDGANWRIG